MQASFDKAILMLGQDTIFLSQYYVIAIIGYWVYGNDAIELLNHHSN